MDPSDAFRAAMERFEGRETRSWAAQPRNTAEAVRELYELFGGRGGHGSRRLAEALGFANVKSGQRQIGLWMSGARAVPRGRQEGLRSAARQLSRQQRRRVAARFGNGARVAFKGHVQISSRTGVHLNMQPRPVGEPGSRSEDAWQAALTGWVNDDETAMHAGLLDVVNTAYLEGAAEASVLEDVDEGGLQFGEL